MWQESGKAGQGDGEFTKFAPTTQMIALKIKLAKANIRNAVKFHHTIDPDASTHASFHISVCVQIIDKRKAISSRIRGSH